VADTTPVTDGGLSYVHDLGPVAVTGAPAYARCGQLILAPVPHGVNAAGVWCPACTRAGLQRLAAALG
jgi:hypothetical protein